jgi:hypothetical protein
MPKLLALERFAFRDIIGIVIASFIIAIAIQLVIVPAYLLTGGLSRYLIMAITTMPIMAKKPVISAIAEAIM